MPRTEQDNRSSDQVETIGRIRKTLADGFAFVRGQEKTRSISSLTLEELIAKDIALINQDQSDIRPGRLTAIRQLRESVNSAVDQAKQLSPELFEITERVSVANTGPNEEYPGQQETEG